ncbi:ABC-2 type transport system ATP-binding protein [Roseivirga ehrenbergii]|uniref:Bacitracin ABC transporter ATP-binding protein n=1 Tax=Roseivirga ehrenbergii (strain DSM 102268 / JCM 13514 / KCTC 12282 / NCIMB 14502 / KMM 6017) TaxID=279360 RepID=A0A150WYV6_ROSEK|nr:ATP-binding cassette domain-containing protein [Roseivirga ehrenbergii]KYG71663.1 bacitracin ABC transporter ATP-binding protein [Roseivirga ehrenbergii]TCL07647.1 ABC-2 type transport system ATP-binding protein [Roseivirga ehrenbergii]
MPKSIIQTNNLTFHFGSFKALDQVNLNVPEGSIYGFLGPNGAGKTTTIRILLDLFHSEPGQVKLFDQELLPNKVELLGKVGALIENPSIYKHLTGRQNLEVVRRMIGASKSRIDEVLKIVRLTDNANKKAKNYSLGMCQRLGLASALLSDPDLLILDEPTNGLDPSGIIEMRELIMRLNKEHGKTIFLSSHILTEIEKMATDVAIIDQGKIMYEGKLDGLHNNDSSQFLEIKLDKVQKATEVIKELNYTISEHDSKTITLLITDKTDISRINRALVQNDIEVYQLKSTEETLEAIFLNLTKKLDQ